MFIYFYLRFFNPAAKSLFFFTTVQHPQWAKASSLSKIHDHTQTHHTR